ncbi:MAG: DUF4142 domain-containing protein [Chitinophagaceae bacterium]|nr:MAG: DUF4142 domain-containing protein [Chitinophagaceae bacterium]
MFNLTNVKTTLIHTLCITGVLFLATSCTQNKTLDSKKVAERENLAKMTSDDFNVVIVKSENDAKFLVEAAEMQLEMISLGKLAQKKGTISHVKEMGIKMEEEHGKSFSELQLLARSKSISIPTTITHDSQEAWDKLNKKSGKDFDQAYSKLMVDSHEDAIDMFEKNSEESKDQEIRAWANKSLPVLRSHLQHAKTSKRVVTN